MIQMIIIVACIGVCVAALLGWGGASHDRDNDPGLPPGAGY